MPTSIQTSYNNNIEYTILEMTNINQKNSSFAIYKPEKLMYNIIVNRNKNEKKVDSKYKAFNQDFQRSKELFLKWFIPEIKKGSLE